MKPSIEVMIHPEMNVDAKRTEKHEESKEEEKKEHPTMATWIGSFHKM